MSNNEDLQDEFEVDDIAIIGMALRVPGADDVDTYWKNLREGVESFKTYSDEELLASRVPAKLLNDPNYVKVGAEFSGLEMFDAGFFEISPLDASLMDPQHRHFMEVSWEALEHAGENPEAMEGSVGVFAGSGQNTYLIHNLITNGDLLKDPGFWYLRHVGNDKDFLSTRVSYQFNLQGPSINLQTACSTSLVAVHTAAQSLLNSECDVAIAGGCTIIFPNGQGYMYQEGGIQDPTGHCRSFDVNSKGTVFGSGAGAVILKRLEDAIRDKNTVHAVVRASAVNNDGSQKAGFTAPSVDGQAAAVSEALTVGEVDPTQIGYVEAHGTATPIGDPLEVLALTQAWSQSTDQKQFCAISSVKSNIGHLDSASGVASLIKAVGALKEGLKYPTVHYTAPNPTLNIESTPFYVSNKLETWESEEPRLAAVSSLGVGGTNAHVILEETPEECFVEREDAKGNLYSLVVSARSPKALENNRLRLADYLEQHQDDPDVRLDDVAYTLLHGRKSFECRAVLTAATKAEAAAILKGEKPEALFTAEAMPGSEHEVVFLFTGQGSQYINMARNLYVHNEIFKKAFDQCAELLQPKLGQDIREIVFVGEANEEASEQLMQTQFTQPALFIVEYAMAQCWLDKGIKPDYMIGHSIGEYVAATLAEVLSLEDALALVCARGRLMQSVASGDMLAVSLEESEIADYLNEDVSLAAVNSAGVCILSGTAEAIGVAEKKLDQQQITTRRLHTSHAFHSSMMDGILPAFKDEVAKCKLNTPTIPFVSNVSGTWITDDQATSADYWPEHLRSCVRFADGVKTLLEEKGDLAFIEVGPGNTLTNLVKNHSSVTKATLAVASIPAVKDAKPEDDHFPLAYGSLWAAGYALDWSPFFEGGSAQKIPLPTYAWDHKSYWITPGKPSAAADAELEDLEKQELEQWFYQPGWQKSVSAQRDVEAGLCLVIADTKTPLLDNLLAALKEKGIDHLLALRGSSSKMIDPNSFEFDAHSSAGAEWVFDAVQEKGKLAYILDLGAESVSGDADSLWQAFDERQQNYFYQPMRFMQALAGLELEEPLHYVCLASGMASVVADDIDDPAKALLYGPARTIASENPKVHTSIIDYGRPKAWQVAKLSELLVSDLSAPATTQVNEIAYRGLDRYERRFDSIKADLNQTASKLKKNGSYLVTGTGGLGINLALHLAENYQAKVALLGRTALPAEAEWNEIINAGLSGDVRTEKVIQLKRIKEAATDFICVTADVTEAASLTDAVDSVAEAFGELNGVFHTAGVVDDNLLAMKEEDDAAKVLAPKVLGIQALDAVLDARELDFLLIYSSVSAYAGVAGQVDYTAANAFVDAYAKYKQDQTGSPVIAVNWGTWQDVGMAMDIAKQQGLIETENEISGSYIYECLRTTKTKEYQFLGRISCETHWLLDQHRTKAGLALVPGTGYIGLVYHAFSQLNDAPNFEINNLFFMSPFTVQDLKPKVLACCIEMSEEEPEFVIRSAVNIEAARMQQWSEEHVRGSIRILRDEDPQELHLNSIKDRCDKEKEDLRGTKEHKHLSFGPRWACVDEVLYGEREALIQLELADEFASDLEAHHLHAAMLDMAIGGQKLIPDFHPDKDFFVPVSYGSIKVIRPLQQKIFSHVSYNADSQEGSAEFDITITDADGQPLMIVNDFILKRVEFDALDRLGEEDAEPTKEVVLPMMEQSEETLFEHTLRAGIKPDEGFAAIEYLLNGSMPSQMIVSPLNFPAYLAASAEQAGQTEDEEQDSKYYAERPELSTPFVEPETETAKSVAAVWRQSLGLDRIGLDDNFFELGGHSLLLTQIVARVRKKLEVSVPVGQLFDRSTVGEWVELIEEHQDSGVVLPPVVAVDRSNYVVSISSLVE